MIVEAWLSRAGKRLGGRYLAAQADERPGGPDEWPQAPGPPSGRRAGRLDL